MVSGMWMEETEIMIPDLRKPKDREGKITLTSRQRRVLLDEHCEKQNMRCAACGQAMTRKPYHMNTATLGHQTPQPMGCKKDDRPENIIGAICWKDNYEQGSKRL